VVFLDIRKAAYYLEMISDGFDTLTLLQRHCRCCDCGSISYNLKKLAGLGLLTQYRMGNKRPYALSQRGERFLKLMRGEGI
jgi:predicted transcriptional regulator